MLASTASSTCSTTAGLVDFEIFLAQRLRDREHVVALALVVLVLGVVADARRRDRGEEHVLDLGRCRRGLQVGEVAPDASWPG